MSARQDKFFDFSYTFFSQVPSAGKDLANRWLAKNIDQRLGRSHIFRGDGLANHGILFVELFSGRVLRDLILAGSRFHRWQRLVVEVLRRHGLRRLHLRGRVASLIRHFWLLGYRRRNLIVGVLRLLLTVHVVLHRWVESIIVPTVHLKCGSVDRR